MGFQIKVLLARREQNLIFKFANLSFDQEGVITDFVFTCYLTLFSFTLTSSFHLPFYDL